MNYHQKYYRKNRRRLLRRQRRRRKLNLSGVREIERKSRARRYKANPEALRQKSRNWRKRNLKKARRREREKRREYVQRHKEKIKQEKRVQLLKSYGLTPEQYASMETSQRGKCAICDHEVKLCVDHDHGSGKVRGLLCRKCNVGIGIFKDSPKLLSRAILYLRYGPAQ